MIFLTGILVILANLSLLLLGNVFLAGLLLVLAGAAFIWGRRNGRRG